MKKKQTIKRVYIFILTIMLLLTVTAVFILHNNTNRQTFDDDQVQSLMYVRNEYQGSQYYKQHASSDETIIYNPLENRLHNQNNK